MKAISFSEVLALLGILIAFCYVSNEDYKFSVELEQMQQSKNYFQTQLGNDYGK